MRKNWRNKIIQGTRHELRVTRGESLLTWYGFQDLSTAVPRTSYLVPFKVSPLRRLRQNYLNCVNPVVLGGLNSESEGNDRNSIPRPGKIFCVR